MDPRVTTPEAGLEQQLSLSLRLTGMMRQDYDAVSQIRRLREQIRASEGKASSQSLKEALQNLDRSAALLQGGGGGGRGGGRAAGAAENLGQLNGQLASVFEVIQGSDNTPTTQAAAAVDDLEKRLQSQLDAWKQLQAGPVSAVNDQLQKAGLPAITL